MKSSRWINFVVLFVLTIVMISGRSVDIQRVEAAPLEEGFLFVKPDSSGAKDCSTWSNACELQDALEASEYGDQIWVASGIYTPTYQTDTEDPLSATFEMQGGVALYGGFTGNETDITERDWETNITVLSGDLEGNDIIDPAGVVTDTTNIIGDNASHVVTSEGITETAMLDRFIITAGISGGINTTGSGMYNYESDPSVSNVIFSGNLATNGAGMANVRSNPVVNNVRFISNDAWTSGGGMYNSSSAPVLNNVIFNGNSVLGDPFSGGNGGGMCNSSSNPVLTDVTFSANTAKFHGGGMYNAGSSPVLTDVEFNGNKASGDGGGMSNANSNPILEDVTFDDNRADYMGSDGGGISNLNSTPVLINVSFINNYAVSNGGGIYNVSSNSMLTDVIFIGNTTSGYSGGGGGMSNSDSSPVLNNVTFSDNYSFYGGGIYNSSSNPELTNVIFIGNQAGLDGGGIWNINSSPELYNVIFSGNMAETYDGGGMWNSGGSPQLINVTFSGNHADDRGGGIYNIYSSPIMNNTILWGNTAGETGLQIFNDNISTPYVSYSDIQGGCELSIGNDCSGGGNINADPLFIRNPDPGPDGIWGYGEDDFGDLRLGPLSPAIDVGDNTAVPTGVTTDLDGSTRFVDIPGAADTGNGTAPIVDMGAYEAVNLAPTAVDDPDYSTDNITPLLVDAPGVLENDSDPNLDPLSAEIGDNPSIGDLILNPDGSFEYLPETEYTGIVTLTYQATDGLLASLPATVTITIEQGQRTIYLPLITHE